MVTARRHSQLINHGNINDLMGETMPISGRLP